MVKRYPPNQGYIRIRRGDDIILEHRAVVEESIGRPLDSSEIVHHVDENKTNNELDNLEVMSNSEHARHHARKPTLIDLTCGMCHNTFQKNLSKYNYAIAQGWHVYCSRSCRGLAGRLKQLGRLV
jgi:hypothetical protein